MNKELYILVGLSVFAFLLGTQLKKKFSKKAVEEPKILKNQRSKMAKQSQEIPGKKPSKHPKIKSFFLWLQVVVLFFIIVFMMPALSRDIMLAEGNYDQKLILRILIVAFAAYTLFIGLNKLFKKKGKW
ncbi:hypothetical protein DWB61_05755 [Ancylomarina euxinus]|uniref:Uncharacterized protein n=1 Tax=Ancylomarina euxinus TaxID=2283627 RepID=A0A425Y3U8_9BACT|nr:hypothetical protein [Ancylomarina euxinus]MCZ4694542.1 hypothetical protein [Ancylomarina euxinus]MUP14085.1 hypothetical protein [Ancylomarina euxinus]RRG22943.1 hypothetical protein DWB61_05755 [Ancylomarina euxinus]